MCFKPTSTLHRVFLVQHSPDSLPHFCQKTALPTVSKSLHNADIQLQILTSKDSDLNQNQGLPSATYRNSPLPLALPSFLINILPYLQPSVPRVATNRRAFREANTHQNRPPPPPNKCSASHCTLPPTSYSLCNFRLQQEIC